MHEDLEKGGLEKIPFPVSDGAGAPGAAAVPGVPGAQTPAPCGGPSKFSSAAVDENVPRTFVLSPSAPSFGGPTEGAGGNVRDDQIQIVAIRHRERIAAFRRPTVVVATSASLLAELQPHDASDFFLRPRAHDVRRVQRQRPSSVAIVVVEVRTVRHDSPNPTVHFHRVPCVISTTANREGVRTCGRQSAIQSRPVPARIPSQSVDRHPRRDRSWSDSKYARCDVTRATVGSICARGQRAIERERESRQPP